MKTGLKIAVVILMAIVVGGTGLMLSYVPGNQPLDNDTITTTTTTVTNMTPPTSVYPELQPFLTYEGVEIHYLRYAGFKLKFENTVVYLDPYKIDGIDDPILELADFVFVSHAHLTHCSAVSIDHVRNDDTILISSQDAATAENETNKRSVVADYVVRPGDSLEFEGVSFEFVPMYNVVSSRLWAHPVELEDVGVIVVFGTTRIYFAADSDRIPEIMNITADIALLPVSGYAEMSAEEAAEAVEDLKMSSNLAYAVPMHWDSFTGSIFDAYTFYNQANCTTVILEPISDADLGNP
ncbi:MAG: MBL fold metallo-hydrolase [Candidatus Thorarchaeota archaeon]|jgi:L-ascorbate metabolism protein UlaG (beta-lactamase superfamily)